MRAVRRRLVVSLARRPVSPARGAARAALLLAANVAVAAPASAAVPTGWSLVSTIDGGTSSIGSSIATTDTVAAVGAPFAAPTGGGAATGAVFVYASAGGTWTSQRVAAPSPVSGGNFGTSVAVSGNLLAVGAPGTPPAAYVFAADAGTYASVATLPDPAGDTNASFGGSVAVYAGEGAASYVAVAAAPGSANPTGAVYVSRQTAGGSWSTPPVAITEPAADAFGIAIAFAGNGQLLVGDPGTNAGQVFVYSPLADGGWSKEDSLAFSLDGGTVQQFGNGIATWKDIAVVTAPGTSNAAKGYNGAAFVFQATDAGVWQQAAVLTGAAAESFANFAPGVGAGLVAVGAAVNTATSGAGQVDVWAQTGSGWVPVPSGPASGLSGDSYFGQAVGVVGSSLLIGDTSAPGAASISDVTSALVTELATYADAGGGDAASGRVDGGGGGNDAAAGGDGAAAAGDGATSQSADGATSSGDGGLFVFSDGGGYGDTSGSCRCGAAGLGGGRGGLAILTGWALLALAWGRRRRARSARLTA